MIDASHERIQPAGASDAWSDSLYFNFFSGDGELAGFTRIGVLPNARSANAGLAALSDGELFAGMIAAGAKLPPGDWDDIAVGGLRYRVIEPFETCAVDLESPTGRASLRYEALAPPFDYADCPVELPAEVASRHYEQHCRVTGWVEGVGGRRDVDGFGQRDHSWGLRDWSGVRAWRWLQAIFGADLAFNVFSVETHAGEITVSGYLHEAGTSRAIAEASIDTEYDDDGVRQRTARVRFRDTDGAEFEVTAERLALLPIPMEGTTVNEGFFRWTLDGRTGYGVYEYLFQT